VIKFKNRSFTNRTYSVIRTDKALNPGAKAHFCFGDLGSCYDELVFEPSSDFCTLSPEQETNGSNHLITELDEAGTVGYSAIQYKLFNMATGKTGADTLSFTLKYNQWLGVNETKGNIAYNSDIYPNPSGNNASVSIFMAHEGPVKLQVHNSLGSIIHSDSADLLSGNNKLNIDCSNYSPGLYFVTLTSGDSKITKRLVVNK
jgi:hypothetical protein